MSTSKCMMTSLLLTFALTCNHARAQTAPSPASPRSRPATIARSSPSWPSTSRKTPRPTIATRPTQPSSTRPSNTIGSARSKSLAGQYLKSDPDGPVKALAQIIQTMAHAHAGKFDLALGRFRELMQGLGQNDQEEFAASFSENLAATAIAAGEVATARQVYTTLLARFGESPNLRQKVQAELKRLDKVGKPAPAFTTEDIKGSHRPSG